MTKTPEKPYPFGAAHTHIAHIREYPPTLPPGNWDQEDQSNLVEARHYK